MARSEQSITRVLGASLETMDPCLEGESFRRFTQREYRDLVNQGWFEDEPIELLRGMLVTMTPQGRDHWPVSSVLMHVLARALPIDRYGIAAHSGFAATPDSEPEPDVQVFDRTKYPRSIPSEALLIIEVSRSSLRRDRNIKRPIYAENGVPEYWIVVLADREVEVYTQPVGGTYTQMTRVTIDGTLRPQFDPTIEIAMTSLPWD